ncbi:MAG TPA: phospholipid carrier-dependent glycosyltransferase [Thermoflexales bacterium]|nr:phospholipid carrier-dependent glycosyltransferase [Thermoflexales bacterium]
MKRLRNPLLARLALRLALFGAAIGLGVVALNTRSPLPLIGALVAAVLALRPIDLSQLPRRANTEGILSEAGDAVEAPVESPRESFATSARALSSILSSNRNAVLPGVAVLFACASAVLVPEASMTLVSAALWITGIGVAIAGIRLLDADRKTGSPPLAGLDRIDIAAMVGIGLMALLARGYDLASYPPFMHGDEGSQGLDVLRLVAGATPSFANVQTTFGFAQLFIYIQAVFVRLFGANEIGLRAASPLFGALTVAMTYAAARLAFRSRFLGVCAAVILTTLHVNVHYSRMAMPTIEAAAWVPVVMAALAMAERKPDSAKTSPLLPFLVAGLATGLAQYFYAAGRLVAVLLILWLARMALMKSLSWKHLGAVALGLFVIGAPLAIEYLARPEMVFSRAQGVSIFNEPIYKHTLGPNAELPRDLGLLLGKQTQHMLEFFVFRGDTSGFYSSEIPPLDVVSSALFWVGFGIMLFRLKRTGEFMTVTWLVSTVVIGGILNVDAPGGPRLVIAHAAMAIMAAYGLWQIWLLISALSGPILRWLAAPLIAGALAFICLTNLNTYFVTYASRADYSDGIRIVRELAKDQGNYDAYVMGNPTWVGFSVTRFMASKARIAAAEKASELPPPGKDGRGIVVVAMAKSAPELAAYKNAHPGGLSSSYVLRGQLLFSTYRIPPAP